MNIRLSIIAWIGLTLGMAGVALAEGVGINFYNQKTDEQMLKRSDVAGIDEAKQSLWNHLTVENKDPQGHNNSATLEALADSRGRMLRGMTVKVDAADGMQVFPTGGESWGFEGPNATMLKGQLHPQPRITIVNVPYREYAVICYIAAGNNGGLGSVSIAKMDGSAGEVDPAGKYFYKLSWTNGQFEQATAKTLDEAKKGKANYVMFKGNTARGIVIEYDGRLGGGWTGAAAIQIVKVK